MKLLAVGDIHLGAQPSRLPEDLSGAAARLGPAEAWRRTVAAAIQYQVAGVLLAGDVVDRDFDFFEGYRELRAGLDRLHAADIALVAVAGNHDVHVLPRLAAELPQLRLLGRGGTWESTVLESNGEQATVWGWSFPQQRVHSSPLASGGPQVGPGVSLGLLHCDLDATSSPYAPVRRSELEAQNLSAWLLGHVHKPGRLTPTQPIGYLGSLTGTDPGEPGVHGPWLITIEGGRIQQFQHLDLAPMHWRVLEVDISAAAAGEDAQELVMEQIRSLHQQPGEGVAADAVGLRVHLTGRSDLGSAAWDALHRDGVGQRMPTDGTVDYFIEKVEVRTRPVLDLAELERRDDPPGLLAARIRLLDRPPADPERQLHLERARTAIASAAQASTFSNAPEVPLGDEEVAVLLREAALRILEQMQLQKSEAER